MFLYNMTMIIENKLMEKEIKLMEKEVVGSRDDFFRYHMLSLLPRLANCNKEISYYKKKITDEKHQINNMLEIIKNGVSDDPWDRMAYDCRQLSIEEFLSREEKKGVEFYGYEFAKILIKIDELNFGLKIKQEELTEIKRKMKQLQKNRLGLKLETKICSKCKVEKEAFDFNGDSYWCKECCKEYKIEYEKNNPEKIYAAKCVRIARKLGIIIKPTKCSVCGIEPENNDMIQGHHKNYDNPLDVDWVCAKHHAPLDDIRREAEEGIKKEPIDGQSVSEVLYKNLLAELHEAIT